jgi:hypothetical protein
LARFVTSSPAHRLVEMNDMSEFTGPLLDISPNTTKYIVIKHRYNLHYSILPIV